MAIRRRRKTLTNLLSNMERRVTAVELRPINLLTSSQIAAATAEEDETLDPGPDSVVSLNAPNQYKPVVDGYYYGSNLTGGSSIVELYFEADPELEKDKTIRISGINKLDNSGTAVNFDISDDYKVLAVDTPPYTGRKPYKNTRDTPGSNITSTAVFSPASGLQYGGRRQLFVKARISTVQATTTTATIVFTTPHYFEQNQIVYVDMPTGNPYRGIDGLFRIKEVVNSTTITYDFDAALSEPINVANVTEERYVHAVAQSAIRDGATWFDTSQDPDVAYVWDDYRWVLFGSSSVTDDNLHPSPVTDLTAFDENDTPPGSAIGRSRITLNWDAPTTNTDGTPLVDLAEYEVWFRTLPTATWTKRKFNASESKFAETGFVQGDPVYFRVYAIDSGKNESVPAEITHTPGVFAAEVAKPKAPAVTTYLGTIKIAYDDLTAFGLLQAASAKEIEVYFSDVSGFTPGPSNYYGKFPANRGSYIIIPGTELVQDNPAADGTDYYVKIIVRDIYGNITAPSDQVAIRVKLSDIVTFDMIDVGTLSGQVIIGLDLRTGTNPTQNGGIIINKQGITAYDTGGGQTFNINALNGAVSIGDYLGKTEAAGLYLGKLDAASSYATIATVSGVSVVAGNAQTVAQAAQNGVSSVSSNLSAITTIEAGVVTIRKNKIVGSLNEGISTSTTTIDGGNITTGTLAANRIGSGQFPVGVVYANSINASQITAGVIVGRSLQTTDSSLQQITISASLNEIRFNTPGGSVGGRLSGSSFPYNSVALTGGAGGYVYVGSNRVLLYGSSESSGSVDIRSGIVEFTSSGTAPGYLFNGVNSSVRISDLSGTSSATLSATSLGTVFRSTSDARLKTDIKNDVPGLDFVNDLKPVSYRWKEKTELGSAKNFGLLAQDVVEVFKKHKIFDQNIVYKHNVTGSMFKDYIPEDDTPWGFEYLPLVSVLIKSIQELSDKVKILEDKLKND